MGHSFEKQQYGIFTPRNGESISQQSCGVQEGIFFPSVQKGQRSLFVSDPFLGNHNRIGFGKLVVFNDDTILPEKGFSTHPHDNMEIITIVTDGTLEHNDNMGSSTIITAGEIQVMTAGTGITHSETNPSKKEAVHLFQIWIEPRQLGLKPSYEQKKFESNNFKNKLYPVVVGKKKEESLIINQDTTLYRADTEKGVTIDYILEKGRGAFIFSIEGSIKINDQIINSRDTIEVTGYQKVNINSLTTAKIILIDVPMSK